MAPRYLDVVTDCLLDVVTDCPLHPGSRGRGFLAHDALRWACGARCFRRGWPFLGESAAALPGESARRDRAALGGILRPGPCAGHEPPEGGRRGLPSAPLQPIWAYLEEPPLGTPFPHEALRAKHRCGGPNHLGATRQERSPWGRLATVRVPPLGVCCGGTGGVGLHLRLCGVGWTLEELLCATSCHFDESWTRSHYEPHLVTSWALI